MSEQERLLIAFGAYCLIALFIAWIMALVLRWASRSLMRRVAQANEGRERD
jgi:hypothetical protein